MVYAFISSEVDSDVHRNRALNPECRKDDVSSETFKYGENLASGEIPKSAWRLDVAPPNLALLHMACMYRSNE